MVEGAKYDHPIGGRAQAAGNPQQRQHPAQGDIQALITESGFDPEQSCLDGLLDYFVGNGQHARRHLDAQQPCSLFVDNEFELSGLHDR